MRLKPLKSRMFNVMFHAHTVSGIVISFALFVIFFAGSISLFMNELYRWENPEARFESISADQVDYDKICQTVKNKIPSFDVTAQFGMTPPTETNPLMLFYGSMKQPDGSVERFSTYLNPMTYDMMPPNKPKTHMAHTLYELHYFEQIPIVGGYLSGLVAFFFIFAIITGLLIHWKNMVSKFYGFSLKGNWKQIWTNSHISLGFIALPFQMIYAITGALLCLSIFLLAPTAFIMFGGDTSKVLKAVNPEAEYRHNPKASTVSEYASLNSIYRKVRDANPDKEIKYLYATNYTKEDATVSARTDDGIGITGDGLFIYSGTDGRLLQSADPRSKTYTTAAFGVLVKLHYANFGGLLLKTIYFLLSMVTCYIIISGVMIWRTARDNARYTSRQKKFHHRVTKFYLAITLSMFPALAIIFIGNIAVPMDMPDRSELVNTIFFVGWLLLTIVGLFWNSYGQQNRNYILIGSILGIIVPLANGLSTGDWLWKTLWSGQRYVYSVDIIWLVTGIFGLILCKRYLSKGATDLKL
ncbi:PepSY-associated TM helix domain-containing protein [Sphingobacterium bambusae]|uniref:PepSY-associated TM helix domain-containing protein n=1 Tax=Sphingobacterium bambusae TaxID=662858 RepID=A0ABW6BJA8_9SPHI|nr:PepSY-associated TM helix domain-containing protein [Sphingobacterium bambusae]WPL49398.1 PepSY-associated TM helix domain-containing protein [Sphingobacterium bambusae]